MLINSYVLQLELKAYQYGVDLKSAFKLAGVPDSTFYRVKYGQDMRLSTALKVSRALEELREKAKESFDENTNIS
jgi:predicted transcriptional regulator